MARYGVKVKMDGLENLKKEKIASRTFQRKLGTRVLEAILEMIAVGKSPVRGAGRFAGYKVDRVSAGDRKLATRFAKSGMKGAAKRAKKKVSSANKNKRHYPNSVMDKYPAKQKRPVNLRLSGDLLDAMKWKPVSGGVKIGLIRASRKLKKIFQAHNEGTLESKNVPRRPILPTGPGEKFTPSIDKQIRRLFTARIRQMLSKNRRR